MEIERLIKQKLLINMTINKRPSPSFAYRSFFAIYTFYHTFLSWYRFLQKSQQWNEDQKKSYQNEQLQHLISHAYRNVPYYQQLFQSNHLKPKNIKSVNDLEKIPLLTKDLIRQHQNALKATTYPQNAFLSSHTGGTTGIPLLFYVEKAKWLGIHFAFNRIYMGQAGYRPQDKIISFTGIKPRMNHHFFYRTLELSSFHTKRKDYDLFYKKINRFKPSYITAFPSALLLYTKDILLQKKDLYTDINAIFCHGEQLHLDEKKFLSETYDCKVYDQYGHREQCVFATTKQDDCYHLYPEYGIVELVDIDDHPLHQPKKTGEIVATSLTNYIFPLIRYKTNDLSQWGQQTTSTDPNTFILSAIQGRTQEFLIGENHEKIPLTGLYHIFSHPRFHIKEYQIIQEKEGELIIHYVPSETFSTTTLNLIKQELSEIFGSQFTCHLSPVPSIPRSTYGKYQYLIQNLSFESY